jgi:Tetracyclin repressor-like, C-terminal domain
MCTAVASWYHRDGPSSAAEIVDTYSDLTLNFVQARRPTRAPARRPAAA